MPKISTSAWIKRDPGPNPLSGQDDGPYEDISLGDAVGLSQFGVRLEKLAAGSRSSHRHWHEEEDEFVYVVSGELVLVEDEETLLKAGDAAGWKAGQAPGHCLENRSAEEAVVLVVGTRLDRDVVHYPDHGVVLRRDGEAREYTRPDGSAIDR